jgi:fructose-specific component phosphotransferase system IIB-like protein
MKAVVQRVIGAAAVRAAVEEVDISADPDLEARYGLEIPVLMLQGKKIAKYRIEEGALMRVLAMRQREDRAKG